MICGGVVTLSVRDVAASIRFYVETLGMKFVEGNETEFAIVDAGNGFRIGLERAPQRKPASEVVFHTKMPLEEAVAILENRGVTVNPKGSRPGVWFKDPDEHVLYLWTAPTSQSEA